MLFPTVTFAAFFAVVIVVHTVLRHRATAWKVAMLLASYIFYCWWDWRLGGLLAASTVVNWLAGALLGFWGNSRKGNAVVALAVGADLAVLGLFKYYDFFVGSVSSSTSSAISLPVLELVLPIGISFYTFQAISYVVDIRRGELAPRSLLDFAVYLAFFPQLVAGPIVRATEFLPQLDDTSRRDRIEVAEAAWLIGRGLFKKVVVATYLADAVVDPVFAAPSLASREELLVAFYGYAIQIYADFSGYTDMAIGIALLLGFRFPTNFDNPYRSRSIQEFWRRWHMTLSRWLRDYLYISLGGNRGSRAATYRNLMLTMVLGGLWHGAAWTFVVWGTIHGGALALHRAVSDRRQETASHWPSSSGPTPAPAVLLQWLVTFHVICLAWVPFRAESFGLAWDFVAGLGTAPLGGEVNTVAAALIALALAAQLVPSHLGRRLYTLYAQVSPTAQSALIGAWVFVVASLGPEGVAPFIYFQF